MANFSIIKFFYCVKVENFPQQELFWGIFFDKEVLFGENIPKRHDCFVSSSKTYYFVFFSSQIWLCRRIFVTLQEEYELMELPLRSGS